KCLVSCLLQRGNFELEVIVVDDHSTDGVIQVLEKYKADFPTQFFYYTNPGKGGNSARNFGFSKSTGSLIQWLDSDDFIFQGKLKRQLEELQQFQDIDVVYSDWRMDFYKNQRFTHSIPVRRDSDEDFLATLLENKQWNSTNSYLCRRSVCEKLDASGGWSVVTKVGQDREYFTQLALNGAKFKYVSGEFAVYNRWSSDTVSNKYTSRELAFESLRLNQLFFKKVVAQNLTGKYKSILNAEIVNICYYERGISIPRFFSPFNISFRTLHWKMRLVAPLIYLKMCLKFYLNR
ncbi:glycosyltransferase family 2 protein, partial [Vicingaceae bacterium]|nr:glycosyltransferase family 2 protein [Vicingaceae bacterium]